MYTNIGRQLNIDETQNGKSYKTTLYYTVINEASCCHKLCPLHNQIFLTNVILSEIKTLRVGARLNP